MSFRPLRLIVLVALTFVANFVPAAGSQTTRAQDGEVVFVRPTRRPADGVPMPPPELPARADEVQPLTFVVVTQRVPTTGAPSAEHQRVSRTRDRIHVATARTEWLFERNPVDPRRVSARLVHHPSRSIVTHEESDLRNTVAVSGWAAVLMLGVDPAALAALTPTANSRSHAGLWFREHTATPKGSGLAQVWWNADHLLPLKLVFRDQSGVTNVTVEELKRGVDTSLLRAPANRFPDYKLVDLAEWLEGH